MHCEEIRAGADFWRGPLRDEGAIDEIGNHGKVEYLRGKVSSGLNTLICGTCGCSGGCPDAYTRGVDVANSY